MVFMSKVSTRALIKNIAELDWSKWVSFAGTVPDVIFGGAQWK
jgi:hypothetical protein